MTMAGCTGVTSRAEVAVVEQDCTIHTEVPGVYLDSITVHTSAVWGLHIPSTHRLRRNHPSTFSRRQPRLLRLRYPMSTNATKTRSTGEFASFTLDFSLRFLSLGTVRQSQCEGWNDETVKFRILMEQHRAGHSCTWPTLPSPKRSWI